MIILKIKEPGHSINIPGLPEFRSPAEVDISNININKVITCLKNLDIVKYEIVSKDDNFKPKIIKSRKSSKNIKTNLIEEYFEHLEKMLETLLNKQSNLEKEQIINKLEKIDKRISNQKVSDIKEDPVIEEIDSFIPDINIKDMSMNKSRNVKTFTKDKQLNNTADALSQLIKSGGKK